MRTRVLSALVGAPLLLAAVLWPGGTWPFAGWPFAALVMAMTVAGLKEFYDGCRDAGLTPRDGFGWAAGVLFVLTATPLVADGGIQAVQMGLTLLVMLSLVVEALSREHTPLKTLAPTWLGAVYLGWLFPFALRLRLLPETPIQNASPWITGPGEGAWIVLFTLLLTMAVDTGAYFAGKTLGKHKLAPEVSPGKTWEGAVGGFLCALLVGALVGMALRLPLGLALAAAALVGIVAQLGDLSKSAVKREIGIKDFGALIPGHGGVLDRFDSLLFAAPTVYWLLVFWPTGGR